MHIETSGQDLKAEDRSMLQVLGQCWQHLGLCSPILFALNKSQNVLQEVDVVQQADVCGIQQP